MIKWVLIMQLFNAETPLDSQQISLDVQGKKKCVSTCKSLVDNGLYSSKPVVHCNCIKANKFYTTIPDSLAPQAFNSYN